MTLFHGEDFHIMLPSLETEVTFRNRSAPWLGDVVLMKGGVVPGSRARINQYGSHLVVDAVTEGDEGTYTIKNPKNPRDVRSLVLVVRGTDARRNSPSFRVRELVFETFGVSDLRHMEASAPPLSWFIMVSNQFSHDSAQCAYAFQRTLPNPVRVFNSSIHPQKPGRL